MIGNGMDQIAFIIALVFFFLLGVGVQFKNPKFGTAIFYGWKKFTRLFKKK